MSNVLKPSKLDNLTNPLPRIQQSDTKKAKRQLSPNSVNDPNGKQAKFNALDNDLADDSSIMNETSDETSDDILNGTILQATKDKILNLNKKQQNNIINTTKQYNRPYRKKVTVTDQNLHRKEKSTIYGPIFIKMPNKDFYDSNECKDYMNKMLKSDCTTNKDKNGDLLIYPASEEAANTIMDDKEFFGSENFEKRNISTENNKTLIIRNLSFDELSSNDLLKSELKKLGINDASKASKNQPSHMRPVKLYCIDTQTRNRMLNNNIIIETEQFKQILYTVPNCKPPRICERCKSFKHATSECKSNPVCGFCNSEDHTDENCSSADDEVECPNCYEAHDAYSRTCKAYKEARSRLECDALQLINNGSILKPKMNEQINSNGDFYRVNSLSTDVSTLQHELISIKASNNEREDRVLKALENSTLVLSNNKAALDNIMSEVSKMVTNSCQNLQKSIQGENENFKKEIYNYIKTNCLLKPNDNLNSKSLIANKNATNNFSTTTTSGGLPASIKF